MSDHEHEHQHDCDCGHGHEPEHEHHDGCGCGRDHEHEHDHGHDHDACAAGDDCDCDCGHDHGSEDMRPRRELAFIIPALLILVCGLVFRRPLEATPYAWAEYLVFLTAYLLAGWQILLTAARNILHGKFFDEYFLMTVATLAAVFIGDLPEAVGVMLFFKVGEFFQDLSIRRSRRSIAALLQVRPDAANLETPDGLKTVSPETVEIGATIIVRPGERVPLDGEIISGDSMVDTAALTGEAVPRGVHAGDTILAGFVNQGGLLRVRVTRRFGESSVSRILELVQNAAARKARTEKFITVFARYYTPAVVAGAVAVAVIPPLVIAGATFAEWIYRAAVLLVISCPCALVISIPLGYFGGIGGASRHGILIKGAQYLDVLARVKTAVFDKTGTLTRGVFKVIDIVPCNGYNRDELLELAAAAEAHSNHPIARSVMEACGGIDLGDITAYGELSGYGVRAEYGGHTVTACNDRYLHEEDIEHEVCDVGGTAVHIAVDGKYAGYLVIADEVKADAAAAIDALKDLGIRRTVMLTGDNTAVARTVAARTGVDEFLAELLPEDKVAAVERLEREAGRGEKIAVVGDGINDAPVIARADVGIAMGALGSDAAIESADVVIMTDHPSKLAEAVRRARRTRAIIWQNIFFALGVKAAFIALGIAGLATMWMAVFADVGVTLLAVFNAARALR